MYIEDLEAVQKLQDLLHGAAGLRAEPAPRGAAEDGQVAADAAPAPTSGRQGSAALLQRQTARQGAHAQIFLEMLEAKV